MKNENLPEDVIESALQFGIKSAMTRFSMTEKEVLDIVTPFTDEIDGVDYPCSCELQRQKGIAIMCFVCEKQLKKRKI